jgi:hypothetical protein
VLIWAATDGGPSSDALAATALGIAILSLVVAAAALGWQIAAWLLEAGRARVQLRVGGLARDHPGLITQGVKKGVDAAAAVEQAVREGYDVPVLAVRVTSTGRAPVTVQQWTVKAKASELGATPLADSIGPSLPKRLEPGETETWCLALESVHRLVAASQVIKDTGNVDEIYVEVELGSGKIVRTPTSVVASQVRCKSAGAGSLWWAG